MKYGCSHCFKFISMPSLFKVVSVNRIHNCCPSYATKALYLASWPSRPRTVQNRNHNRAIVNDRKHKSSRIHVLCYDVALPFLSNAIRGKPSSKKTSKRRTERKKPKKKAKMTYPRFASRPKAPKKSLAKRPICSLHKIFRFLTSANEIRMRSLVRERNDNNFNKTPRSRACFSRKC